MIVSTDKPTLGFQGGISPEPKIEIIKELAIELGSPIKREGKVLPMIAIDILKADLSTFQSLSNVKEIWYDFKIFNQVNEAFQVSKIPGAKSKYNLTGKGERVYVLDQGMDLNHPAIKNNIVGHTDLVGEVKFVNLPDEDHATHVGGIIASNDPKYPGVAPDCELWSVKILDSQGSGPMSIIIEGIDTAIDLGADIINLSVGGINLICVGNCPICEAINRASDLGVTVVVAAGNYGFMPFTITCPTKGEKALSVGACDDNKNMAYWSSRSGFGQVRKPDFVTAGVDIISAKAGGGFVSMSGTSMATPIVAGMVALIQELAKTLGLDIDPIVIRKVLMESASNGVSYISGKGVIDLDKALEIVKNVYNLSLVF